MSAGWIKDLKSVGFTKLVRLVKPKPNAEQLIDAFASNIPPGFFVQSNENLARNLTIGSIMHDWYMGATCDSYEDLGFSKSPKQSIIMGSLEITYINASGKDNKILTPLILAGCTKYTSIRSNTEYTSGCKGLFMDSVAMVVTGCNQIEMLDTFRHETIHALVAQCKTIKDQMYGDTEVVKLEEVMTHIVTDHFDKLNSMSKFDFSFTDEVMKNKDYKLVSSALNDVKYNGKSIIGKTIEINDTLNNQIKSWKQNMIKRGEW